MRQFQNVDFRFAILSSLAVAGLSFNSAASAACVDPNTCYGSFVLDSNTSGSYSSGFGYQVLANNTSGTDNSGFGYQVLASNTTGGYNTASGERALYSNTTGSYNTASGVRALFSNTTGFFNTASGRDALYSNTTGYYNTASGAWALELNSTGSDNTASGAGALQYNTTGYQNTASGAYALISNTTGFYNTASGVQALFFNSTGNRNTANGTYALYYATGHRNVALGFNAGNAITTGVDNIMIGAGQKGKANDTGVIRIGISTFQKKAFIAGIRGVATGLANAVPVVIDANGQLGTISSSRRFKEDIQPMGSASERLLELRPVTFRYKQPYEDGRQPVQFGLVAEEVAQVFPELVVYGEDGETETVRYDLLATMLVNEFQAQANRIAALEQQSEELAQLKQQVARMAEVIDRLDHAQMVAAAK